MFFRQCIVYVKFAGTASASDTFVAVRNDLPALTRLLLDQLSNTLAVREAGSKHPKRAENTGFDYSIVPFNADRSIANLIRS